MITGFGDERSFLIAPDELTALRARLAQLEREIDTLTRTNHAISALASCDGTVEGRAFLDQLSHRLADILKVSHVLITELPHGRTNRLRVVAGWSRGRVAEPMEYDLADTPCQIVLERGSAFFPKEACRLFPHNSYLTRYGIESYMGASLWGRDGRTTGHLCIMDEQPFLFEPLQGHAIVKVFAQRAGAELERLRADEAIRQREEWFRTLYDDNPSMYFTLSPDGRIVSVNRYGAAQLGYTVDELVDQSVLTVFDVSDQETVLAQLQQCADHPFQTFTWEIQKIRKDGSRLWVHERARAIVSSDGGLMILVVCEDVTEHRRTSRLLATLIHESPLPIISLDRTAKVTSWNPAAAKLFGWSEEEVVGKELPYIPPGEEEAADLLWEAGVRGKLTAPVELRRQRKDGTLLDLLLWPVYVRERPGHDGFETAIGILVDQSNLVQAEAARRESERRLRMIIDSEPECIKTVDAEGLITSINPAGIAMLRAASERDILGKPVLSFIHPQDRPTYERFHRMVCAGERGVLTCRLIDLCGRERHIESHAVPLRDDAGVVTGTLSITRDITVRKQAEEALRVSEATLHRFIANAPVGLVIANRDGRLLHVNRAFCELTGYDERELIGRTCALYTHPDDLDDTLRLVSRFAAEQADFTVKQRYIRKNGDTIWVSVKVTHVQLPNRDQPLLLTAVQDITEQRKSERLLEQEKQILESIAGDAPLSSVLETICTMVEATAPHLLCSIVFLDPQRNCLRPGPAPSLPPGYVALVDGIPIGPSVGSCGTAIYTGQSVIVSDIATDPLWAPWRHLPLAHGLRSCWSIPIKSPSGQVLGSFAIYSRTPRHPTPADLTLMERIAHLAGIAMARARVKEEREQLSQDLHDNILQSLYAIGMQLEANRLSSARSSKKSQPHIAQAIDQLNRLVSDVRQYIACLKQTSPPAVDFGQALRQMIALSSVAGEPTPEFDFEESVISLVTPEQGEHLLNIAREALSNSVRHSGAKRRLVRVSRAGASIRLEIRDDGIGFAPKKRRKRGHGLSHMAARARRLGARFTLESQRGKGTHIIVDVPIKERA